MKIKLAVFYFTTFSVIILLTAEIIMFISCPFGNILKFDGFYVNSFDLNAGKNSLSSNDGGNMNFTYFKNLPAQAVFCQQTVLLYKCVDGFSVLDEDGNPFSGETNGYPSQSAYSVYESGGKEIYFCLTVIDDLKGGALCITRKFENGSKDGNVFADVLNSITFV